MPLDIDKLRELRPRNAFHYFQTIGSTMTEASRLASATAAGGTVVLAEEQTSGVGRLGRSWISEPEVGIYASILLRLPLAPSYLPLASLLVGLAVAEAIERSTKLACDLRWPNDVLIAERKVAGILPLLVESYVVVGVGINVNNSSFPSGLRTPATSLFLASGARLQSREKVLASVLESLDSFSDLLIHKGTESVLRAFTAASSYVTGRRIVAEENGVRGVTEGLDDHGFLLVRLDSGRVQRISSGSVRPDSERSQ